MITFGESRIVCGIYNASAVAAGRLSATATLAALDQMPVFRDDLAAAQAEMAALPADPATPPLDAAQCRAEAALVEQPIF